jgi:hypothetical protein
MTHNVLQVAKVQNKLKTLKYVQVSQINFFQAHNKMQTRISALCIIMNAIYTIWKDWKLGTVMDYSMHT